MNSHRVIRDSGADSFHRVGQGRNRHATRVAPDDQLTLSLQIRQPADRLANELIPHFKARQASSTVALTSLLCILSGADERQRGGDDFLTIGGGQFQRVEGERALVRSFHGRVDAAFRNAAWQIALEADVVASKEHQGVRRNANDFGVTENAIAIHLGCQQGGKGRGVHFADHVVDDDGRAAFHQRCEQTFAGLFEVVRMRRDGGLAATDGRHHVGEQGLAAALSRGVEGEGRRRWQQRAHHGRQDRGQEHGVVRWASQRKQAHGLPDSHEGLSDFGKRRMSGHRKRDHRQCGKKLLVLVVPVFVDQCARDRVNDGRGHHGLQCRKAA
ncbi:hypothetical protein SDC9_114251 [bioreactor metagenome]|uniref:Uncharacterized protein n=1 Tax=bioreactor metagenome TaxID=1076179 RepID=A0A645BPH1_9ZZZZ